MPVLESPPARERVFFALWPAPPLAAALHEHAGTLVRECGGRRMRDSTLHMTLVFVGAVPAARLPELNAAAAPLRCPPFDFSLDHCGRWRDVVWAGVRQPPTALSGLTDGLRAALAESGFAIETRAFVPHVTLLRRALASPSAAWPALPPWRAHEFVLVASRPDADGARYVRLAGWPLRSA